MPRSRHTSRGLLVRSDRGLRYGCFYRHSILSACLVYCTNTNLPHWPTMQHLPEQVSNDDGETDMAGGRMSFDSDEHVRILTVDGHISNAQYSVVIGRANRRGHVTLQEIGTTRQIKVTQRRVLVNCAEDGAFVVASGDKFRAVCPQCTYVAEINPSHDAFECPTHGTINVQWRKGERPLVSATASAKPPKKAKTAEKKPPVKKQAQPAREQIIVDLQHLAGLEGCELWTKSNVRFDHAMVDVRAHTLICINGNVRKLCFNTYDGTLGKRGTALPIDEFLADTDTEKKRWYNVKSVDAERARLTKDGYTHTT